MLIFRHESPFELNELPVRWEKSFVAGIWFHSFLSPSCLPSLPLLDLHMEVLRGRMTHSGRNFLKKGCAGGAAEMDTYITRCC